MNDTFVESSPVLQDLQSSVLNMRGVMVREGSITFTFRVCLGVFFCGWKSKSPYFFFFF